MKDLALNVAGFIFIIVAGLHFYRYFIKLPVRLGEYLVPLDSSLYAGIIVLILAIWMFFAATR